jgi:hypothetical protein
MMMSPLEEVDTGKVNWDLDLVFGSGREGGKRLTGDRWAD